MEDVAPYEDMKLRLLNGSHTCLAYASSLLFMHERVPPTVCHMAARASNSSERSG